MKEHPAQEYPAEINNRKACPHRLTGFCQMWITELKSTPHIIILLMNLDLVYLSMNTKHNNSHQAVLKLLKPHPSTKCCKDQMDKGMLVTHPCFIRTIEHTIVKEIISKNKSWWGKCPNHFLVVEAKVASTSPESAESSQLIYKSLSIDCINEKKNNLIKYHIITFDYNQFVLASAPIASDIEFKIYSVNLLYYYNIYHASCKGLPLRPPGSNALGLSFFFCKFLRPGSSTAFSDSLFFPKLTPSIPSKFCCCFSFLSVIEPTSTKPNPTSFNVFVISPCLSNPAARPIGLVMSIFWITRKECRNNIFLIKFFILSVLKKKMIRVLTLNLKLPKCKIVKTQVRILENKTTNRPTRAQQPEQANNNKRLILWVTQPDMVVLGVA
ncbi:hypothetical protein AGLY_011641 [Aphis glycines]|uniref:Uncharacterized protein n=1 Tax=Aphis glycines TaxID=307491 RepID=A0A6G0TB60_APHGL|nr:hypothetical protein AGLY_011641 [Aphis glycines]